jgi:hypothetical protein
MLYSIQDAPLSLGTPAILLFPIVAGLAAVWASLRGRHVIRGFSGRSGLVVQGAMGFLFATIALASVARSAHQTSACRQALGSGQVKTFTGPIEIVKQFSKPGAGYIQFKVGNQEFETITGGTGCDCGYVLPMGRSIELTDHELVEIKAIGRTVLSLHTVNH